MLQIKDRKFKSLDEYFLYIAETLGYPQELKDYFVSDVTFSDGISIHLDVYEYAKEAPTVVFMPGTSLYALCYAEFMWKLGEQGFNVIGFDPRGHGQSEGTRGDYTITELTRDAQSVITWAIQQFNSNVSLMGSSQGGIVSFYTAAIDERLKGVTCQNFADLLAPETIQLARHPRLFKYLKALLAKAGNILPAAQIPITSYIDLEKIPVRYFGNAKNFIENDPLTLKTISLKALQSLATTSMAKPVEEIKVPVMVFQGDADSIFPVSYTQQIFNKINSRKKMTVFPGMTHALMHENTDDILPEIVSWLREIHGQQPKPASEPKPAEAAKEN
ncbi:MAG: alpha/beta fold hydrolase [Chitinophagales bacterium]